jgi:hypothetical protein
MRSVLVKLKKNQNTLRNGSFSAYPLKGHFMKKLVTVLFTAMIVLSDTPRVWAQTQDTQVQQEDIVDTTIVEDIEVEEDKTPVTKVKKVSGGSGSTYLRNVIAATWPVHLRQAAYNVAWCESSGRPGVANKYGFKGLFQFGSRAWRVYGAGNIFNGYDNSAAAYRYYKASGWSGWECNTSGGRKKNYG